MIQKFVFKKKTTASDCRKVTGKSKFVLKKVDVPKDVPLTEAELKLERLEKELAEEQAKQSKAPKDVTNLKPQKRPSTKRVIKGNVVMFERWSPIVKAWAKDKPVKVDLEVGKIADRVDVVGDGFRVVIMASYDNEFTISLFYNYDLGFNSRRINVEYVKVDMIQTALDYVVDGQSLFKFKEGENVNTANKQRQ